MLAGQQRGVTDMHLTRETDYAFRIMLVLAQRGCITDAAAIAESVCVSITFTLKILHKLQKAELVIGKSGVSGGYVLACPAKEIPLYRIYEAVNGQIAISPCLKADYRCERVGDCDACFFHCLFEDLNQTFIRRLHTVTLYDAATMTSGKLRKVLRDTQINI